MISVESSSERMFWNIIFYIFNVEKIKIKEKGFKSYYKNCSILMCILYIYVFFFFRYICYNIMVFINKLL